MNRRLADMTEEELAARDIRLRVLHRARNAKYRRTPKGKVKAREGAKRHYHKALKQKKPHFDPRIKEYKNAWQRSKRLNPEFRKKSNAWAAAKGKKGSVELSDNYIRKALNMPFVPIPKSLLEMKRAHLALKRAIKEITNAKHAS